MGELVVDKCCLSEDDCRHNNRNIVTIKYVIKVWKSKFVLFFSNKANLEHTKEESRCLFNRFPNYLIQCI